MIVIVHLKVPWICSLWAMQENIPTKFMEQQ